MSLFNKIITFTLGLGLLFPDYSSAIKSLEQDSNAIEETSLIPYVPIHNESSFLEEKLEKKIIIRKPRIAPLENLETLIESYVEYKIPQDEKTSFVVYDIISNQKLVSINEDTPMQAASMIKPLVMLAYFHQVKGKKLEYTKSDKRKLERMIQKSNNYATNYFIRKLGGPRAVERILKDNYRNILCNISIVEYIPRRGRTYKNKASAHDYSRFLYALWNSKLPHSREMKRIMALPGRDRLYTGARKVPCGILVYNKTGTTARLCGDMGILVAKDKKGHPVPYIIIGIVEKRGKARPYSKWIISRGNVIREVSDITYNYMAEKYNLERN